MQLEFHYTADDYADAATLHARSAPWTQKVMRWVLVIALLPIMLYLTGPRNIPLSASLAGVAVALLIGFFSETVATGWLTRRFYKRQFSGMEALQMVSGGEFDDTGFSLLTSLGQGKLKWHGLVRWVEDKNSILLLPHSRLFYMLPKRAFSVEQLDQIRHWLLESVGPAGQVRSLRNTGP